VDSDVMRRTKQPKRAFTAIPRAAPRVLPNLFGQFL
jgi:hypothetical protein